MKEFARLLCRLHDGASDAGYAVGTIGLAALAVIYCYEVLTRYFLGVATDWANDMFSNILCVTIFAMVPHATRRGQHIAISLLAEIKPSLGPGLRGFASFVGFIVCLLAAWMSYQENVRQIVEQIVTPQNHPIPQWWMSVWITFGFAGASFYFLRQLIDEFRPNEIVKPVSWITPNRSYDQIESV